MNIPYSYKNGVSVGDCAIEYLNVPNNDYSQCEQKYFILRVVSFPIIDGATATNFSYNDDIYSITTLTPQEAVELLASVFTCPNGYCSGQEASFDYTLTPLSGDAWTSQTIVNEVLPVQPNLIYSITAVTVDATPYVGAPVVIWDDTDPEGNASTHVADYISSIITFIESLSIPQYLGAVNDGKNGVSDNLDGTGQLKLFFTAGSTVVITITEPTTPINGTFTGGVLTTYQLELELEDTSVQATSDVLTQTNYQVTDADGGFIGSTETPDGTMTVFNLFCNGLCGLNRNTNWVLSQTIITQNSCARNNVSTGILEVDDITDAIDNQVTKNGNSIA